MEGQMVHIIAIQLVARGLEHWFSRFHFIFIKSCFGRGYKKEVYVSVPCRTRGKG